jgi:hypothetical protein
MLLTCPTCRSGLAVPDGTTALVRCPACKSVFSPADGLAPPEPEPEEERPKKPARKGRDEDEDEKPRKKKPAARDDEKARNRDFDPVDPEEEKRRRRKRRREEDEKLSPEERRAVLRAFARAAWGAKLIWISFGLFIGSMMLIILFWFMAAVPAIGPRPGLIVAAGVFGAIGWLLGAIGVGLGLSGPPSPGHWGYGIGAAVATFVHLLLLLILIGKAEEYAVGRGEDPDGPISYWGLIPTRLDTVTFYLTFLIYKDQEILPKGIISLSIIVGLAEMIRAMMTLMLLSCLAQAAGDKELSGDCTRAAGYTTWGPGFLALGILLFAVVVVETRLGFNRFTIIILVAVIMGIYAVLAGCMFPGFMVSREVADACDEPFQSQIPQL